MVVPRAGREGGSSNAVAVGTSDVANVPRRRPLGLVSRWRGGATSSEASDGGSGGSGGKKKKEKKAKKLKMVDVKPKTQEAKEQAKKAKKGPQQPRPEPAALGEPVLLIVAAPSAEQSAHNVVELPRSELAGLGVREGSLVLLRGKRRATSVFRVVGVGGGGEGAAGKGAASGLAAKSARLAPSALRNLRLESGGLVRLHQVLRYGDGSGDDSENGESGGGGGGGGGLPVAVSVTVAPFGDTLPAWLAGESDAAVAARAAVAEAYFERLASSASPLQVGDHFKAAAVRAAGPSEGSSADKEEEEEEEEVTVEESGKKAGVGNGAMVEWKVLGITVARGVNAAAVSSDQKEGEGDEDDKVGVDRALVVAGASVLSCGDGASLDRLEDDEAATEVTFADVGGCGKAVVAVRELVEVCGSASSYCVRTRHLLTEDLRACVCVCVLVSVCKRKIERGRGFCCCCCCCVVISV